MKKDVLKVYNELYSLIQDNYNQIKIIDNYDWNYESPYTIFYLNKEESFEKFEEAWEDIKERYIGDLPYDDICYEFDKKYGDKFDYINLGSLNVYTNSEYELTI